MVRTPAGIPTGPIPFWTLSRPLLRLAQTHSAIGFAMVAYGAHKLLTRLLDGQIETLPALLFANLLLSIAFIRIRYPKSAPELRYLTAGVGLILGMYVAIFPHWLPGELRSEWPILTALLVAGRYVVPLFALAGLDRPSAVLTVASYVTVLRVAYPYLYGLDRVGGTDYIPLIEIATFASLSLVTWTVLRQAAGSRRGGPSTAFGLFQIRRQALPGIFVASVGVFLANYFYSGVAKILLDGTLLTWILDNRTATLIPVTMSTGHLPVGHWPSFTATLYDLISRLTVLNNSIVVLAELGALVAIARKRWIVAIAGTYCALHVLIFVTSGIFFWKWILLNLVIALAVWKWRRPHAWPTRAVGTLTILAAPLLPFATMTLAWYDTPAINKFSFEVELDDGRRLELPTNFFGPVSLTPAQMRLGTFGDRLFPTRTWGMSWSDADRARLLRCDSSLRTGEPPFPAVEWDSLEGFFGKIMAQHREHPGTHYDLFPHHIFSNPFLFDFTPDLTPRITRAYYVSESYCVSLSDSTGRKLDSIREERLVYGH